ncbi:EAL domain-containing protein [Thiocystis violacea]|uniref:EAL domain-containing protein n=1 Tax=Thiocystis violacea TaxID=13725 RepID=UPI0019060131|nr:EAL domain-containing protein [Thiocystis violacea]MBK1723732.1 GGDEF domain-containing protein [Thiocystis violacea]
MSALTLDQDLSVHSADPVFLDLLGYKDADVVGRSFAALILSGQTAGLVELLDSEADQSLELDLRFISARGGSLPASVAISKVADLPTGEARRLSVILQRLDREYALQQMLWLDEALSLARAANWELEIATGRILASQNWFLLWGLSPDDEVTVSQTLQRVHPQDRTLVESAIRQAIDATGAFHIHFRIQRPDGQLRWAECTGRRYPDDSGLAGRMGGAVLDITEQRAAEQALARYADIVSATSDRIAFIDRGCRILAANTAFLTRIGRPREAVIGLTLVDACGEGALTALIYRNLGRCLDQGDSIVEDIREADATAAERDAEVRLFPHRDEHGCVTGVAVNVRDVTAMRDAERRLLQSAAVYGATSEGVLITDASGTIVSVNAAFTQITGYAESEVLGQKPSLLNSQWHSRGFFVGMWRRLLRQGSWQGEIWNRRKDGEIYHQRLTIRRIDDARGKLVNFVGVFAERTSAPDSPHRTEQTIHYDALTKLPNRLLFEAQLEHAIKLGGRKDAPLAVFILDLDHFSHINSSLGYKIGDDLLRTVARTLREAIRPSDTLARLRGDQFGLLIEEVSDGDEVTDIAKRLQEAMRTPIWVHNHLLHVNISIGIALTAGLEDDHRAMITEAESALRQVKRQGRNGFHISTTAPNEAQAERLRYLELLKADLSRGDLKLLYRPGVDMESEVCDYVEAVVHWETRELGAIPPERMLSMANEIGLMVDISDWALESTCRQLQSWLARGLPVRSQTIGICEPQLTQGDLVRKVARVLEENPLVAPRLVLEFSESLLVKHRNQIAEVFQGLNQLRVGIILNEVGLGWTAPAVLQRLPIKGLKIHPTFIAALPDSAHELAVVEALIAMAQSLHLDILADGVRTDEQKYQLMNLGCSRAQGDMFSEPLTAARFEAWISPKDQRRKPPEPLKS